MKDVDQSWGAVVFDDEGRYLLVHHAGGNHWDHPKGHANTGETPIQTARREICEEGGVTVDFIRGFEETTGWILPDGRPKQVVYFLARRTGNVFPSGHEGEILEIAWLPYMEARERITYETGRDILDRAEGYRFLYTSSY